MARQQEARQNRSKDGGITKNGKKRGRPPTPAKPQLKPSHFKAVQYYMRGDTKTQALIKAGYSPITADKAAWKIFGREDVQKEIEAQRWAMRSRSTAIMERIQDELAKIAFFNIGKVIEVTEDGDIFFAYDEADMDDFAAIGEITIETYTEGKGEEAQEVKRVKCKPYDKKAALDSLARIHGMFKDSLLMDGDEDSLEKRLQRGRDRARLNAPDVVDADFEDVTPEQEAAE